MATQAGGFIRDQNLNVHFDVAPPALKTHTKTQKNGGLGGRKVLGDISNSRMPSTNIPPNKKLSSKTPISVSEDFVPTNLSKSSFGSKTKVSSTKSSGRKVLGDLTNSANRLVVQELNKARDKKLCAVLEEPPSFHEEGFLHDHKECLKAQQKAEARDLEFYFKQYVPVFKSTPARLPPLSAKMKIETPVKVSDMEVVFGQCNKNELFVEDVCESPVSVPEFQWENDMTLRLEASP